MNTVDCSALAERLLKDGKVDLLLFYPYDEALSRPVEKLLSRTAADIAAIFNRYTEALGWWPDNDAFDAWADDHLAESVVIDMLDVTGIVPLLPRGRATAAEDMLYAAKTRHRPRA